MKGLINATEDLISLLIKDGYDETVTPEIIEAQRCIDNAKKSLQSVKPSNFIWPNHEEAKAKR